MTLYVKCTLALLMIGTAARLVAENPPPKPAPSQKAAEMAEDVEVLRLLLNKSLTLTLPENRLRTREAIVDIGRAANPEAGVPFHSVSSYPQFDGVYLKGHGAAYTIRLSVVQDAHPTTHEKFAGVEVTCQNCHVGIDVAKYDLAVPARSQPQPPTEWERTRDAVRGVPAKLDPAAGKSAAVMCTPGDLTETVTKLLAANGRHLRHLTADESVTVVVTYDGVTGAAHDRVTGTMADPTLWDPKAATPFGLTADEAKQIVLGDLHFKQGKPDEAVKAYEAALARYPAATNAVTPPKALKPAEIDAAVAELQKSVTAAYRSLAQAYIGVGNLDEAKRALALAQQLKIEPTGGAKKAAAAVPAKILLTVKKGHLDAADKLSPAEFRKGVTVEMVGLNATKK